MIEALFIAGTFDHDGGKPSGVMKKLLAHMKHQSITVVNGGSISDLISLDVSSFEVIYWFPNIDNSEEKILPRIKEGAPHATLVMSKFNDGKYDQHYLEQRMLSARANLLVEIQHNGEDFTFRILDSLGSQWLMSTYDISVVADALYKIVAHLRDAQRVPSHHAGNYIAPRHTKDLNAFFALLKRNADTFHELIHGVYPERFLGNASFRSGGLIYMSQRNIDKRNIGIDGFVPVNFADSDGDATWYYGPHKPSVDTPIQIALYDYYPNVSYMIHSHVYAAGAPITTVPYACGDLREVIGVTREFPGTDSNRFVVNLLGHGMVALGDTPDFFTSLEYIPRDNPEILSYRNLP